MNSEKFWENMGYAALALTIIGQIVIGANYIFGQGCWLAANGIYVIRNFTLERPRPDKIKDACMTALTLGLIVFYSLGGFC